MGPGTAQESAFLWSFTVSSCPPETLKNNSTGTVMVGKAQHSLFLWLGYRLAVTGPERQAKRAEILQPGVQISTWNCECRPSSNLSGSTRKDEFWSTWYPSGKSEPNTSVVLRLRSISQEAGGGSLFMEAKRVTVTKGCWDFSLLHHQGQLGRWGDTRVPWMLWIPVSFGSPWGWSKGKGISCSAGLPRMQKTGSCQVK